MTTALLRRFSGEPLPEPLHGSEAFKQIILKACTFNPKERYQKAEEMLHDLEMLKAPEAGEMPTIVVPKHEATQGEPFIRKETDEGLTIAKYHGQDEMLVIPSKISNTAVAQIGEFAFFGSTGLRNIAIPGCVKKIERGAFMNCIDLVTVSVQPGTEIIAEGAFQRCSKLLTLFLPDTISQIGSSAFSNCENLSDIFFNGYMEQWERIEIGQWNESVSAAKIYFKDGKTGGEKIPTPTVEEESPIKPTRASEFRYDSLHDEVWITRYIGRESAVKKPSEIDG